jgi:hypothetical protein
MFDRIQSDGIDYRYQLIDMHNIDCEHLLALDTPDALVLAVLCDFKGRNEKDVLVFILKRLQELTGDNEYAMGKYALALETLSDNRNLKQALKEAEDMLRTTTFEQLPSYEIGFERGIERGRNGGMLEMFINLLNVRFPNLDVQAYKDKISNAAEEQLNRYSARLFLAKTPEEVFTDEPLDDGLR